MDFAAIISLASLIGAAVGWFLNQFVSKRKEREDRRRQFIGFITQWRSEITAPGMPNDHVRAYNAKDHAFVGQCAMIEQDFADRKAFTDLCRHVRHTGQNVRETQEFDQGGGGLRIVFVGLENFVAAIDALIFFAKKS